MIAGVTLVIGEDADEEHGEGEEHSDYSTADVGADSLLVWLIETGTWGGHIVDALVLLEFGSVLIGHGLDLKLDKNY
jgi:hypothetical protein